MFLNPLQDDIPTLHGVAAFAVRAHLAAMHVGMAVRAIAYRYRKIPAWHDIACRLPPRADREAGIWFCRGQTRGGRGWVSSLRRYGSFDRGCSGCREDCGKLSVPRLAAGLAIGQAARNSRPDPNMAEENARRLLILKPQGSAATSSQPEKHLIATERAAFSKLIVRDIIP